MHVRGSPLLASLPSGNWNLTMESWDDLTGMGPWANQAEGWLYVKGRESRKGECGTGTNEGQRTSLRHFTQMVLPAQLIPGTRGEFRKSWWRCSKVWSSLRHKISEQGSWLLGPKGSIKYQGDSGLKNELGSLSPLSIVCKCFARLVLFPSYCVL